MQKNATPTKEQQQIMKANGFNPFAWAVEKDKPKYLIIRHRFTGEFKAVAK